MTTDLDRGPWPLRPNRVTRFYRGGALLERFRGVPEATAADSDAPEDWVGSATRAWTPPGAARTDEGLSSVTIDGRDVAITDLVERDPVAVAGRALVDRAGPSTGVLVKLLDAGIRLPVHLHPSRSFARRHLRSFFGKAEAWIILATRDVPGEDPPSVRLGFRRDVDRDELRGLIGAADSGPLVEALHERPARPGDVWFVPPGVPHAIGAGVFIAEIQEPADFSIVLETTGFPIDADDANLRLGWDVTLDAVDLRGWDDEDVEALRRGRADQGPRVRLTPGAADPYFRADALTVTAEVRPYDETAFLVAIVTAGQGSARVGDGKPLEIVAGDTFAVPAVGLPSLVLDGRDLALIACLPPRPDDLDRTTLEAQ